MTKDKYFLIFTGFFIFGIFISSYFHLIKILAAVVFIVAAFISVLLILFKRDKVKTFLVYFCAISFVFGLFYFQKSVLKIDDSLNNRLVDVSGVIVSEQKTGEIGSEYKIKPLFSDGVQSGDILIKTRLYPIYNYGDVLNIKGKLTKPESFPGFDYAGYLAKENVYFIVYYPEIAKAENISLADYLGPFDFLKLQIFKNLYKVKSLFLNAIKNNMTEPHSSFISGIILGANSSFSKELADNFRKSGISHIVAVSGYNVTIIIIYLFFLLDKFYLRRNQKFYIASLIVFGYAVICGFQASVVRAAIMGFLVLAAKKEKRIYGSFNAIAAAAFLMLLENPKILRFDAGFQLSFLATLGLIYIYPHIQNIKSSKKEIKEKDKSRLKKQKTGALALIKEFLLTFRAAFFTTISAQLAVFPILVSNFSNFSLMSVLVNVLILPFIPLAMFLGFFGGLLAAIPFIGKIVLFPAYLSSFYVIKVSEFFAGLNFHFLEIKNLPAWFIVVYYAGLFCLIIFLKKFRNNRPYADFV